MTVAHFAKYAYLCAKFIRYQMETDLLQYSYSSSYFLKKTTFPVSKNQMRFPLPTANAFFLYGQNHLE